MYIDDLVSQSAVQICPEEEDENNITLSAEERQRMLEVKQETIQQITGLLREKDVEYATLLEDKMALQLKLLAATGLAPPLPDPNYTRLVGDHTNTHSIWSEVCQAIKEVSVLASSLYASGTNLSRSISSAGERQSSAYVSPTLPRRAETFGGFDNQHGKGNPKKPADQSEGAAPTVNEEHDIAGLPYGNMSCLDEEELRLRLMQHAQLPWSPPLFPQTPFIPPPHPQHCPPLSQGLQSVNQEDLPPLLTLGREQQVAAVRLSHYVYTLMCIIWQQLTTIHSLEAQLSACKVGGGEPNKPFYKHNQQLEELRNLQDKLSAEKAAWNARKDQEARTLTEKAEQLARLERSLAEQQGDVAQQRERLYRRLEALAARGLLLPDGADKVTPQDEASATGSAVSSPLSESSPTDTHKRKDSKWKNQSMSSTGGKQQQTLPLNLISAQNQQKIVTTQNVPVKQQLPLKLASKLSNSTPGGALNMPASANPQQGAHGIPQGQNVSHSVVHGNQLLPLRLSQGTIGSSFSSGTGQPMSADRRYSGGASVASQGYQRLVDNDHSPVTSHSRTGSSPAMMGFGASLPPAPHSNASNKATRTNTYPKLPDRFRVRSPESPVQASNMSPTLISLSQGGGSVQAGQSQQRGSVSSNQGPDDTRQSANPKEEEVIFF